MEKIFKKTEKSFYLHADVNLMCPEMYEYARNALSIPLSKLVCMNFILNEEYKYFHQMCMLMKGEICICWDCIQGCP